MENNLDLAIERAQKALDMAKTLTTKDRKALKSSTYCGPGRSFPITDCAHYTAALRLLNRSKFSDATKAKIRSCVMSKGKKMNCPGANDKKKETSGYITSDIQSLYDSPEFESTKKLVEESIANPGMDLEFDLVYIE